MRVTVESFQENDSAQVVSLLDSLSETNPNPKKSLNTFRKLLKSGLYFVFNAKIKKKVVATASILIVPSPQHVQPWGYIDNVVVAKEFQRRGIGKILGKALLDFAGKKKCYKVVLSSRFTRPEVHLFWESLGFEKHGFSFRKNLGDHG